MKSPRFLNVLGILLLLANATAFAFTIRTAGSGGGFATVQLAINASAASGDEVRLLAGNTFNENVNIDRSITITGIDTSAKIHGSITINFTTVTLQTFVVFGSSGDGIFASGKSTLTFNNVVSRDNTGSGAQLTTCTTVTINGGSFSGNLAEGINARGGSTYTMTGVSADWNGNGADGSGINVKNISTVTLTDLSANHNHHHGLSVGDGATGVTISGGNFTSNGTAGDATTGGGINFIASGTTTTSAITLSGVVNSSDNTTAGIYIFSDNATVNAINTVTIGATGSITLSNNGSSNITYSGGAGVLVYGIVSGVSIANTTFTKGAAPGSGLLNLGDGTVGGSPAGTSVAGCTFSGYTSARPAVSLTDNATPTPHTSPNNVTATTCTFIFPVASKVFLQGPFAGPNMNTDLLASELIPLGQPYAPLGYSGTESVVAIPANIVDWILIELRATSGGAAVSKRAAFLKNDGTVVELDGTTANVSFTQTLATGYTISDYIVVKHRNHLAVMSANPVTLPNEASAYNFTNLLSKYFGGDAAALSGGVFGLYAGDTNQDQFIDSNDYNGIVNEFFTGPYTPSDANLDGFVDSNDYNPVVNNFFFGTNVP